MAVSTRRVARGEKVFETVARDIVRRIRAENLPPGTLLPSEAEMLSEYGVGRGSLREALRVLEVLGLITIKAGPGGGPVVSDIDRHAFGRMATLYFHVGEMSIRELMEARLVMEPLMARLAAERRDPTKLAELRAVAERAEQAELGSDAEYLGTSNDLHAVIAGMSGNRILDLFGSALHTIFQGRVRGMLFPVSRRKGVRDVHSRIVSAIESGDADLAESLMRQHMIEYAEYARKRHPALFDEVIDWN
jgi:DNA-binding FadR family transcriptional regulator